MSRRTARIALSTIPLTLLVLLAATPAVAQEPPGLYPEPEEMMRLWEEYSTPDAHHDVLARLLGDWTIRTTVNMPGGEQPSEATASCRWVIPELIVGCESEGTFMGEPNTSFSLFGYDKFKKKYVSVFTDTWSTAINTAEGVVVDRSGELQVMYGTVDEFLTGEHDKPAKYLRRWHGDDEFAFEVWDLGIGDSGGKVIEMTWTRQGGGE